MAADVAEAGTDILRVSTDRHRRRPTLLRLPDVQRRRGHRAVERGRRVHGAGLGAHPVLQSLCAEESRAHLAPRLLRDV